MRRLAVGLVLVAACSDAHPSPRKADEAPAAPKPAPAATWTIGQVSSTLALAGLDLVLDVACCNQHGRAPVTVHKGPRGATLTVGKTAFKPAPLEGQMEQGLAYFDADVSDGFAAASLDSLRREPTASAPMADIDIAVHLELPGYQPIDTHVAGHSELEWPLYHVLGAVTAGPVTFAGDAAAAGAPDAAVILWEAESGFLSVHKTKAGLTVADLDWIAIPTQVPTGTKKTCSNYAAFGGAATHSMTFALVALDVTVYDRRTGATVGTKRFPPATSCPKTTATNADLLLPPRPPIQAWLDDALRRGQI